MSSTVFARTRGFPAGVFLLLVTAVMLAGCAGGSSAAKQEGRRPTPRVPVAVKTVRPGTVNIYATYPGRIKGAREVEVQSRVEGILLRRHYNEGAFVKKGQLLFTIDPTLYKAVVQQRKAQLAKAQANLDQAQEVWERVSRLYESNDVSEARRDEAFAQLQTAQAAVALAKANLKAAQTKLDYTTVEAPLSGVTSLEEVDVGALVTQGTVLTTITQLDPVHVRFAVPAEDALMGPKPLAAVVREVDEGEEVTAAARRHVRLILPSGEIYEQLGFIDFAQSTIDPSTGTVRLRAVFDNSDRELVPGRFVRVRLLLETRKKAIVIPNKAIADSQVQTRVLVVTEKNIAKPVPVELGPVVEGGRIIEQGLEAGDRVIVIGLGAVRPGAKVAIKSREKLALDGTPATEDEVAAAASETADEAISAESGRRQHRSEPALSLDKQNR